MANHDKFLERVRVSRAAAENLANWIRRERGYIIQLYPYSDAPTAAENRFYRDHGDFGIIQRAECKHLTWSFNKDEGWPYEWYFICACHQFDDAFPMPWGYFNVSKDEKYAGFVSTADRRLWTKRPFTDRYYEGQAAEGIAYAVPREQATIFKL